MKHSATSVVSLGEVKVVEKSSTCAFQAGSTSSIETEETVHRMDNSRNQSAQTKISPSKQKTYLTKKVSTTKNIEKGPKLNQWKLSFREPLQHTPEKDINWGEIVKEN